MNQESKAQVQRKITTVLGVVSGLRDELMGSAEVPQEPVAPFASTQVKPPEVESFVASPPVKSVKAEPPAPLPIPQKPSIPDRRVPLHTFCTELFAYTAAWALWGLLIKWLESIPLLKGVAFLIYFATYSPFWVGTIAAACAIRLIFFRPNSARLEILIQIVVTHAIGYGLIKLIGFPF